MNKRSSSVAQALKLKHEQTDDGDRQGSSVVNCLELRLGISSDNGSSPWPVDPWSLAARQQKASLEKAHQRPDECDLQRENRPAAAPPQQPVGWPPVRAFRKNLSSSAKTADDALLFISNKVKPAGSDDEDDHGDGERRPPAMFVKVNLEGCAVGRKVDLQAHRGYGSLSRALQSMFRGFLLSDGQWRIASSGSGGSKDEDEERRVETTTKKKTYILLYEDNEGDRMLVGDVPWELFVASVRRLYIAQDTRTRATIVS